MLGELILFLPSIFGLTFGLIALISKKKTTSVKALIIFLFVGCTYFFVESSYLREITDYQQYIISDILTVTLAMMLPVTTIHYLNTLSNDNRTNMRILNILFVCAGIGMGASSAILYSVMGIDNATSYIASQIDKNTLPAGFEDRIYQIHFLLTNKLFYFAAGIEALFVIYVTIRNLIQGNFRLPQLKTILSNEHSSRNHQILNTQSLLIFLVTTVMTIRICMGRVGLLNHMTIAYILSAMIAGLIFLFNIVAFSSEGLELNTRSHTNLYEEGTINAIQQGSYFPEDSFDMLKVKFENAMKMEKVFLDPDLTITTMAISMETNRTYLSRLVNMMYKTDFRTYINNLRINYAKDLILKEPSASMEYVALKSGFKTLSQFNRKFKEIDGDTPRRWQLIQMNEKR